jgi:hypothetical protein
MRRTINIPLCSIAPWRCATKNWRQYVEQMRRGVEIAPVEVIRQSTKIHGYPYRLFDGYHRARAAKRIGWKTIKATVIVTEV